MKFKILTQVLDYEKNPIKKDNDLPMTFRDVVFQTLNSFKQNEDMPFEKKILCGLITRKAYESEEPDFTIEELALIRERAKVLLFPVVLIPTMEFFEEPKENK